jgi:hypothetical protein
MIAIMPGPSSVVKLWPQRSQAIAASVCSGVAGVVPPDRDS